MRPGARLAAAIEVLADIEGRKRPAADALKDWGLSHRFAGSGDRAAIGNLVYDSLRKRSSHAWRMQDDGARALGLAVLRWDWGWGADAIAAACDPALHGPAPLREPERAALSSNGDLGDAPAWVRGDFPEWLAPAFAEMFGQDAAGELAALAGRAPLDLRVNTLKADVEKVRLALERFAPALTPLAPAGLRIAPPEGPARSAHIESDTAYVKGFAEVQDEASQLAAALAGAKAGEQVVDLCAGAGGKTLAMAAQMGNRGQIYATDLDRRRLAPIHERVRRAGVRCVQVLEPGAALESLRGRADLVFVDAPCTGSGVWRRRPDAKWRLRPQALEMRCTEQRAALEAASAMVKPGGRLVYATCSLLPAENQAQIAAFLTSTDEFTPIAAAELAGLSLGESQGRLLMQRVRTTENGGIVFSPLRTGCDGFFFAALKRRS